MLLHELYGLAHRHKVVAVVTSGVLFYEPGRRILQDVVSWIRHNVTIDDAGIPTYSAPRCSMRSRWASTRPRRSCATPATMASKYVRSASTSRWDCTLEPIGDDSFAVRLGFRQVRGLANKDGAEIVAARADRPFESVDDLWRRSDVPVALLVQLAEANAMNESLGLARRQALWVLKALRDEPLGLFAAASRREARTIEEIREPAVSLRAMTAGGEVVEDYRHVGLTLRQHPASFLRPDLTSRRIVTCADAMNARDGKWLTTAGLVLVRQKPGSAKGVMFITIEDETGVANLVVWPSLYERQRRIILAAGMIAVQGRIQREGEVVHLVANHLTDLSADLAGVGERDDSFPPPHGRGDEFHHGSPGIDPRSLPPKLPKARHIYVPDLHIDSIKVKTRDFR
jgi:error-prone DNA polymerase